MRILYGINGTGNGHIVKSNTIIKHLHNLGNEIDILVSGTNHQIELDFPVKYKFQGLSFQYDKWGGVDYLKTAFDANFIQLIKDIRLDVGSYDRVVTDFEPISAWACYLSKKSSIGVSHQYAFLSDKSPRPESKNYLGEIVLRKLAPVTKPIGLHFDKYDNFILHPVIREDILSGEKNNFGHYCVYLPSFDVKNLVHFFQRFPFEFHIFSKIDKPIRVQNILILPNSGQKFRESFLTCEGIITSAGFETPSEALFLGKKLMTIPIHGQYEQKCNAVALSKLGVQTGNSLEDCINFFYNPVEIKYNWENPIPKIIDSILE
jgi:uncharacterized protein (TIGR00661 family)